MGVEVMATVMISSACNWDRADVRWSCGRRIAERLIGGGS
jgi:hypothetical protein